MNGRKEKEKKMYMKIRNILNNQPKYMDSFYMTLFDKSYTTQFVYIKYVIDFISYIRSEYKLSLIEPEEFAQIKPSMINSYLFSLRYDKEGNENGNSIKASKLFGIKSFFSFLKGDDYISDNPCDDVTIPREKKYKEITVLTPEEIEIVKRNILNGVGSKKAIATQKKWRSRDMALIMLALSTGLRVASLTEINIEDLDMIKRTIIVTEKGNKTREVKFGESIMILLREWLKDRREMQWTRDVQTNALFLSGQLNRISERTVYDLVVKYTEGIDKKISPHKLRSSCATIIYEKTNDIYLTAEILGHASIENTKRYAKISDERKKKAASIMDDVLF